MDRTKKFIKIGATTGFVVGAAAAPKLVSLPVALTGAATGAVIGTAAVPIYYTGQGLKKATTYTGKRLRNAGYKVKDAFTKFRNPKQPVRF